jgi:hypothetical protein
LNRTTWDLSQSNRRIPMQFVPLGRPMLTFHLNVEIERIREAMAGRAELQDAGQEQMFGWS